jgi:hypothetical protein
MQAIIIRNNNYKGYKYYLLPMPTQSFVDSLMLENFISKEVTSDTLVSTTSLYNMPVTTACPVRSKPTIQAEGFLSAHKKGIKKN